MLRYSMQGTIEWWRSGMGAVKTDARLFGGWREGWLDLSSSHLYPSLQTAKLVTRNSPERNGCSPPQCSEACTISLDADGSMVRGSKFQRKLEAMSVGRARRAHEEPKYVLRPTQDHNGPHPERRETRTKDDRVQDPLWARRSTAATGTGGIGSPIKGGPACGLA